ncbi:armadillo repeat-containing protein 6 homolog [Episyrphus balteatus]|uniref:armadillo repeat-containing protein 6 homolog n=1 Tax=Episyrphus balteatus TaxID=286459 RepID=UPI002485361C|nr:armadillo repeat-containing protein 6 homolog [Episyrphus balteatus]
MAKVISQETFDDVVKENIVDFSMSPEEAKEETIKQFEAQGINLANIIKDLAINKETGVPILNEAIDHLKTHIGEKSTDTKQLLNYLTVLDDECKKSIPHRVLAGKNGAHDIIITLLEQELSSSNPDEEILSKCVCAAISLTNKQPDLFDAEALAMVMKLLSTNPKDELLRLTLQWLGKACIMHETNRQNIMNADIMKLLKPLVHVKNPNVMKDVCAVLRYLVLDDDIRVEFGKAHEHARLIAAEVIVELCKRLSEFDDITVLADMILTIGTLAVRNEFCVVIEEAGGLKLVLDIMSKNKDALKLNREGLKLLRALAGNDTTKVHIIQQGAAPVIKELLQNNMNNEPIATAALACISTLTLRVKENSTAFFETGIAETIVETLRLHPKNKMVQRNGAWAIRNMVSRSRDQCDSFLSCGAEDLLNAAMAEHPSVSQDIKAALRDLNCKVELKEEFTGKAEKIISKE